MVTQSAYRQTSYASVVLTEDTGVKRDLPIDYSVALMKDTGGIRDLKIDGDQWRAEKNEQTELNWPITRSFLKTDKSWIEYRALTKCLPIVYNFRAVQ